MKLQVPFVQLPLTFDAAALSAEIAALGEEPWRPHPQGYPGNSALTLLAVDGDPDSDAIAGPMRPTPYFARCPYLVQVLHSIGAVWGRTRLMRLSGNAEVTPHVDINYYWRDRVRVHVPIETRPSVRFICGEAEVNMAPGECWIFDTWRRHRVVNAADDQRIHLVADTVGSASFWDLVGAGRTPGAPSAGWSPRVIGPRGGALPTLDLESFNVPRVMTPWELRDHVGFLLAEAAPHPQLAPIGALAGRFVRAWHALWSRYGDTREGWPAFRALLDPFAADLERMAQGIHLRNQGIFLNAMKAMVVRVALSERDGTADGDEARDVPKSGAPARTARASDPEFDRPVFIVSPPRSGSTMLFETLAKSPDFFTVGGESHAVIESIDTLHPSARDFDSNALTANEATPDIIERLRQQFRHELRDRDGRPAPAGRVRMLEKTPKNALRVPFFDRVFPEAHFVYLYRNPRQVLASLIETWTSGRFRTYPKLPGWIGPPWAHVLTPGWRDLIGRPIEEVVAAQWEATTRELLDALEALPRERWSVASYDELVANPAQAVPELCERLDVRWDRPLGTSLPVAQHTVSMPAADKWRVHETKIEAVLPNIAATLERAARLAAR